MRERKNLLQYTSTGLKRNVPNNMIRQGAGELTLTSRNLNHELVGVDAQEQLAGFKPRPSSTCAVSIAHTWYFLVPRVVGRKKFNCYLNLKPTLPSGEFSHYLWSHEISMMLNTIQFY
jgi:hypothetical protein